MVDKIKLKPVKQPPKSRKRKRKLDRKGIVKCKVRALGTCCRKTSQPCQPNRLPYVFKLEEIVVLESSRSLVRMRLSCSYDNFICAMFHIDVSIESVLDFKRRQRNSFPMMNRRVHSIFSRNLPIFISPLEGRGKSAAMIVLSSAISVADSQIYQIGAKISPDAVEACRMRMYEFLERELPSEDRHLQGIFFFARALNLRKYMPRELRPNTKVRDVVSCAQDESSPVGEINFDMHSNSELSESQVECTGLTNCVVAGVG